MTDYSAAFGETCRVDSSVPQAQSYASPGWSDASASRNPGTRVPPQIKQPQGGGPSLLSIATPFGVQLRTILASRGCTTFAALTTLHQGLVCGRPCGIEMNWHAFRSPPFKKNKPQGQYPAVCLSPEARDRSPAGQTVREHTLDGLRGGVFAAAATSEPPRRRPCSRD